MQSKDLGNYECEGQMDISDFLDIAAVTPDPEPIAVITSYKRKPLIYHMGLSAYYFECPYCRATNSEKHSTAGTYCGICGKYFDGVIERKTKDLIECEKQLGSGGGAVYKDDKGNWHYSNL